jgi:hypothetical protein
MVYNEYGELVDERTLKHRPSPSELSVVQILRVIRKAYHHQVRKRLSTSLYCYSDILVCTKIVHLGSDLLLCNANIKVSDPQKNGQNLGSTDGR